MSKILTIQSSYATPLSINKEYERVSEIFEKSFGSTNVCISAIFKLDNPALENEFEAQILEITHKRGTVPKIMQVFHGTAMKSAKSIIKNGFDPKYSTVAAFGKGTYSSPNVTTALGYCKDARSKDDDSMIFLCDMVLGTYGSPIANNIIDTKLFDYSGNLSNIYVTPYKTGIIPKYLICYYAYDK